MDSISSTTAKSLRHGAEIVWHITGILEILLLFRFFLKILGANPDAAFTNFIYQITYSFASPFLNVFPPSTVDSKVFEWSTFLAMFVFWLLALLVIKLFLLGKNMVTPSQDIHIDHK